MPMASIKHIVIVTDFLPKSILTTRQEKQKTVSLFSLFFSSFFLNEDCFNINYLDRVYRKVD